MTNSPITYHDEDAHRVHDDCVEGDTASEGDTSDEEDIEASRNNSGMRRTSSLKRKEGLELPSGSADRTGRPRARRRKIVALAIVAVVATSAAIGGAIYFSTKDSTSMSPSTTIEGEYATSSSIAVSSSSNDETIPSTVEDENDSASDSEAEVNSLPKGDSLGLIEEMVDPEETIEKPDKKGEKEGKWPELKGMTGEEAQDQLEVLYGEETYDIIVLPENSATTRDYRFDRIRIFVNEEGIVTKVPHVG
jgi:hypothetical protein